MRFLSWLWSRFDCSDRPSGHFCDLVLQDWSCEAEASQCAIKMMHIQCNAPQQQKKQCNKMDNVLSGNLDWTHINFFGRLWGKLRFFPYFWTQFLCKSIEGNHRYTIGTVHQIVHCSQSDPDMSNIFLGRIFCQNNAQLSFCKGCHARFKIKQNNNVATV